MRATSAAANSSSIPPTNSHLRSTPLPPASHHTAAMSAAAFVRSASRARVAPFARRAFVQQKPVFQRAAFSSGASRLASADVDAHDPHHEESFEEFTARYADPVSAFERGGCGGFNG